MMIVNPAIYEATFSGEGLEGKTIRIALGTEPKAWVHGEDAMYEDYDIFRTIIDTFDPYGTYNTVSIDKIVYVNGEEHKVPVSYAKGDDYYLEVWVRDFLADEEEVDRQRAEEAYNGELNRW